MKTVQIEGMSCQHCVMAVAKALQKVPGVKNVQVSLDRREAAFDEETPVDMGLVREAVKKAGYNVP